MTEKFWTKELVNGSLTLDSSYGFTFVSLVLTTGTATLTGTATVNGTASGAINLTVDQPVTIQASPSGIIDSLVLVASSGTVQIIARQ